MSLSAEVCTIGQADRSVLEVALECGFDSHEGFTRAFARHFGLAPREFRRRHTYDITRQPIAETTFLYKEARCSRAQIAETLGQNLPAVFGHAMKHGRELRSPPMTLYVDWGPGMVTLRAGLAVAPGSDQGDCGLATLPACLAAVTVHTGPYDGLPDAHAAVEQFLAEEEVSVAGAPREIYLTDPGEVPDPKDWKTQIVWPVAT